LEDAYAAGRLIQELPEAALTDAAQAALAVAQSFLDPLTALKTATNGQVLLGKGRGKEVEWCSQVSAYNIAGFMDGAVVRPIL
jgi:phosphosulfolactate phosphohydrolase-like enzyme